MKKIYSFSLALIVLLSMAASANAAPVRTYSNIDSASAHWEFMNQNGPVNMYLDIYDGDLYLQGSYYDANGVQHDLQPRMSIPSDALNVDNKKLDFANLSEISVPADDIVWGGSYTGYVFTPTTLTIKLDWTGVGYVTKGKSTDRNHDYTYTSTGAYRSAVATGSIFENGKDLLGGAASSDGQISHWDYVEVTKNPV